MRRFRAALAAAAILAALPALALEATEPYRYRQADLMTDGAAPPPADARWGSVELPDRWTPARAAQAHFAWYRVGFDAPAGTDAPWMLYLPRMRDGGDMFLNGALLARVPVTDAQRFVRWMRPFAFPIPPAQLRAGRNELLVRMPAIPDSYMSTVWVGPEAELRPRYESRNFWVYTTAQTIAIVTMVVALFVIAIWVRRRLAFDFGLFGLAALFWGLRTLSLVIEDYPRWAWLPWRVVNYAATGGFVVAMMIFMLRFAGIRLRWLDRLLIAYWPTGPLILAVGGLAVHDAVDRWYQAGLIAIGALMFATTLYAGWRQRTAGALALCGGVLFSLPLGVHDYLLSQGFLDVERPYILHFGAVALLLVVGTLLVDRFVRSLRAAEQSSEVLAQRVAERERELAANFDKLRAYEREHAASVERQRIMQDMHDGLGSQLLTSLAAVERGALDSRAVAQVLREAMDDMRIAIDTLSPGREGLLEALGNLRYRLEPRFRAAGIELSFAYGELPERLDVAPDAALQILRVLQEALSNVLKHARAAHVRVEARVEPDPARFVLGVFDDGGGFSAPSSGAGRGLPGMHRRAQRIGAALDIASDAQGTRVVLTYPLPSGN